MTIMPDDKDWTWVLDEVCPECGFDTQSFPREQVGRLILENAAAWPAQLEDADVSVRHRADRWSTLEYACHVRDVFRLYNYRLGLMLTQDDPLFPNWDQDATAMEDDYNGQDPAVIGPEILAAAETIASSFAAVTGEQWQRPGRRSDGAKFTVETIARYFVHDPIHHLWDVTANK